MATSHFTPRFLLATAFGSEQKARGDTASSQFSAGQEKLQKSGGGMPGKHFTLTFCWLCICWPAETRGWNASQAFYPLLSIGWEKLQPAEIREEVESLGNISSPTFSWPQLFLTSRKQGLKCLPHISPEISACWEKPWQQNPGGGMPGRHLIPLLSAGLREEKFLPCPSSSTLPRLCPPNSKNVPNWSWYS